MKKILLLGLILYSTVLLAYEDQVIIKITNATDSDCVLTKSTLIYGKISEGWLPDAIFRDQTVDFRMSSGAQLRFGVRKDKMLLLTYRCADNQEATLFANISPFQDSFFNSPQISTFSEPKHMEVETQTSDIDPLQVHWTLKKITKSNDISE